MKHVQTQIYAHRGASRYAPENTMAAFKLAYKLGAEGIETDVHLTKDSIPVIIHDEKVNRTTNGIGLIKDFTFNQLRQFDSGLWFSNAFVGEQIISLDSFLKWISPTDLKINIELKNNKVTYRHLEAIVYEKIQHYDLVERTIFSTFNHKSIKECRALNPALEVAWLTSKKNRQLIKRAFELEANAIHIHYRLLSKKLIQQAQLKELPVRVYTPNKSRQMIKCFTLKCDGIFTDLPDIAKIVRDQK